MKNQRVFSLFSGIGGFEIGLPKDWEIIGFSEIDKYASMVLNYHYPQVKNYGDCSKIKWEQIPDFDLLTGGSPCQDFSIAGKRRGLKGAKSSLAWEFIRGLRSKNPRYFIWENVKGVMSSRSGWDFANLLTAFSESGYSLWWQVLNAKDFGVPQNRERIFVIGFRDKHPKEVFFERSSNGNNKGKSGNELREQVANTLRTNYSNGFSNETYIQVKNKGASQHYRVYGEDGLAPTLRSQSGMSSQKHPFIAPTLRAEAHQTANTHFIPENEKIRRLMPLECERLMSWPDDWTKWGVDGRGNKLEISDSQRYKMCGNGVVSNVVKTLVGTFLP